MPSVIGLDLGQHTFRGVEIDKSKKGMMITHSGIYDNPEVNSSNLDKASEKKYIHEISEFVKETGFSTRKVILALEEKDIFMRVITVPQMSDKELKSSINFEAEQYIPLPLKEVNLSYQKIDVSTSEPGRISVQLVAAKKDMLERYVKMVKESHLTPIGVEPEALSIARALSDKNDNSASIILHIGFRRTIIIIAIKGQVVFTRTLSHGGDSMTRSLAQELNLDYVQAEEYKKVYGLNKDQAEGKIYDVLEPIFQSIGQEIGRAQVFFTSRYPGVTINKVLLSGGTALMPGLLLYMANNSSVEVESANPFKGVSFSKNLESKRQWHIDNGPLFTTPVGLALKEV